MRFWAAICLCCGLWSFYACSTKLGEPSNVYIETRLQAPDVATTKHHAPNRANGRQYGYPKTLKGKFSPNEEVIMQLNSDGTLIQGSYYRNHICHEMELRGSIDANGKIRLNELDDWGFKTGVLRGKFDSLQVFYGYRSLPDGSRPQTFRLLPVPPQTYQPDNHSTSGNNAEL